MQETRQPQWFIILIFTSLGLFILGLISFLTTEPGDQTAGEFSQSSMYRSLPGLGDTPERIYLNREQWKSVGGLKLRYNGLDGPHLLIDVIIEQLDPEFAYTHRIPIKDAKAGFRLVDQGFSLAFVRESRISLKLEEIPVRR